MGLDTILWALVIISIYIGLGIAFGHLQGLFWPAFVEFGGNPPDGIFILIILGWPVWTMINAAYWTAMLAIAVCQYILWRLKRGRRP